MRKGDKNFNPQLAAKIGLIWFLEMVGEGKSVRQIAMANKRSEPTVKKYINLATDSMVDAAQMAIMDKLFPKALKLYEAEMDYQIAQAAAGKQPDLTNALKLMKGMFIFNRPQLQDKLENPPAETIEIGQLETLADVYKRKMLDRRKQPKALVGEVANGNEDQTDHEDGDGERSHQESDGEK